MVSPSWLPEESNRPFCGYAVRPPWKRGSFGEREGVQCNFGGGGQAQVTPPYALHNLLFLKVFFLPKESRVAGGQPRLPLPYVLQTLAFPCRAVS